MNLALNSASVSVSSFSSRLRGSRVSDVYTRAHRSFVDNETENRFCWSFCLCLLAPFSADSRSRVWKTTLSFPLSDNSRDLSARFFNAFELYPGNPPRERELLVFLSLVSRLFIDRNGEIPGEITRLVLTSLACSANTKVEKAGSLRYLVTRPQPVRLFGTPVSIPLFLFFLFCLLLPWLIAELTSDPLLRSVSLVSSVRFFHFSFSFRASHRNSSSTYASLFVLSLLRPRPFRARCLPASSSCLHFTRSFQNIDHRYLFNVPPTPVSRSLFPSTHARRIRRSLFYKAEALDFSRCILLVLDLFINMLLNIFINTVLYYL